MRKRYAVYSSCLLILLTLVMASGFRLTSTNFSVIGNRGIRRIVFLLWGALTGNYFYLYTEKLIDFTDCRDRVTQGLLFCTLVFFATAVGIPYIPERVPGMSRLHVQISFLAALLFGAAQLRLLILLQRKIGRKFPVQWLLLTILGAGSVTLLLAIGIVSSLLEIFIICGSCLYLLLLHWKLKKLMSFV